VCNYDWHAFGYYYAVPWIFNSWWLVSVTYLQHHDPETLVYGDEDWKFVNAAFETVDRTYGFGIDWLHHHITDGHVAHHLFFTKIPHYNLPKATVAIRQHLEKAGLSKLYKYEMRDFIDTNIDTPLDLLTENLAKLVAIGGFRKLAPKVRQYLNDPRTERLFSFQAMYAGLSPQDALAIYAIIAYMDSVAGVYFPKGGMHALPKAMAAAAEKHGVQIHYSTEVTDVEMNGNRAVAVRTANGERFAADAVVLNPDLPVAYRQLLGREPWNVRRLTYSPSCFLFLAGSSATYTKTAHHNIHFGRSWDGVFRELIKDKRLMSDPSILVTNPTYSDPDLAPAGKQIYYVLFPTPNLDADIDWRVTGPRYRDEIVRTLEERGYIGFGDAIEVEHVTTPLDWAASGLERGAPFASAHSFIQTGPFRPANLFGENVVFTGSGTQPGVGVPMVLVSGRLAAERITGVDRTYAPTYLH
jgi:phytoene desaturase